MKWRRSAVLLAVLAGAAALRGDLSEWVQNLEVGSRLQGVFFRSVSVADGSVLIRRPPKETRPALSLVISASPSDADLYSLRALEDEQQLDFAAAEADWRKYVELSADKPAAQLALADFYHRRLRPADEIQALSAVAQAPDTPADRLVPADRRRAWRVFQRIQSLVDAQALPVDTAIAQYRAWIARYPQEPAAYAQFLDYAVAKKQFAAAEEALAAYSKAFSKDDVFAVRAHASIEQARGSTEAALAVYERSFRPLWPQDLVKGYFDLLRQTRNLRRYLAQARAAVAANPFDLNASARIFYYYQQQGNLAGAQRALIEFRARKEARKQVWTADELFTLARLFEASHNYDEAARHYYALYSAEASRREDALAGLTAILLEAPDQPIRFGAGDLSLYRDVATMDPYPGFLNGVLSLVLNTTYPAQRYASAEQASTAYFHRARAAELLSMFDAQFAKSPRRAELHAKLIGAYAGYAENDGVINAGRRFLAAFPNSNERSHIALLMAEAYARKGQTREEFAAYDDLLKELAARADGVPLGSGVATPRPQPPQRALPARSPEYARVLERYISRLVSMKRTAEALALLRREIDRNPNDPGLYERLAGFLEQNRLGAQVEQVYRRAIQQFQDQSWYDKLARWYLRRKQAAEFDRLTQEVVRVFSGTELEKYFRQVIGQASIDDRLYLQVNLYARQRFPHNLTFVRNLLSSYQRQPTADPAAWQQLIRNYWFYGDDLRSRYFEFLSYSGRLGKELEAVRASKPSNPAAVRWMAEAEAWRSHFEEAAPAFAATAADFPADGSIDRRAASLERSLVHTDAAAAIEENLHKFAPRDHAAITRIGETYADREAFDRARPWWNGIAEIEPGRADGYIEAATVFWDYYQFDDALRLIGEGRRKLGNAALYAYEAGAIYENKREEARAVEEYVKGALSREGGSPAESRLLTLSRRPNWRPIIEAATSRIVTAPNAEPAAVELRAAVLERQNRRDDLEKLLMALTDRTTSFDLIARIDAIASRQGFDRVRERSLVRRIAISSDPIEKRSLRLALMRYYEGQNNLREARRIVEALHKENPAILGVVRATTDFYWRAKEPRRAVETLTAAASKAYPALRKDLLLEAARKSTESSDYARARRLLEPLLKDEPFRPEYLAAMADNYARQGDDSGLAQFLSGKIKESGSGPVERVATLRRALIPALTRMRDYAAAVDQYIEIINKYAEDEGLVREATLYAAAHGRADQIRGYYTKTAVASPRDYRWPMVLARIATWLEDYPGAIVSYGRAIEIRPDRTDLYTLRAGLEERLLRFADAERDYARLYELTYRNPQWMEKVAEIRMRQGRTKEAVTALHQALVEGRPERPDNFFEVARRLEQWNLLEPALDYAGRGANAAGNNLLTDYAAGAGTFARILTRLRRPENAWARLQTAAAADAAREGFRSGLQQIASAVDRYFSPEEKASFADFLQKQRLPASPEMLEQILLPVARAAGLAAIEAQWLYEIMLAHPGPEVQTHVARLRELQSRRIKHQELGGQLEAYWKVHPRDTSRDLILDQAAEAYRAADAVDAELRVLALRFQSSGVPDNVTARYFNLLRTHDPKRLVAIAASAPERTRDAAANIALAGADPALALDAVRARGLRLAPVWTKSYVGLVSLYYTRKSADGKAAFVSALGPATIGERVGKPVDRGLQLAGDIWFYYGSRYGEYLAVTRQDDPEDYLPAMVEGTPGRAGAYFDLAEYYREAGDAARALADYRRTLQLDPLRGGVHDRIAVMLWEQGQRDEAIAEWRAALESFSRRQDRGRLEQSFWEDVKAAFENIGRRNVLDQVRAEADRLLSTYIRRNGGFQAEPLLEGAMAAAVDPAAGVNWIADLSRAAKNPPEFLGSLVNAAWLSEAGRDALYRRLIEEAEKHSGALFGDARAEARSNVDSWRIRYAQFLIDHKQTQRARVVLDTIPEPAREARVYEVVPLDIRITAAGGDAGALIDRWRRDPDKAPRSELIRNAAASVSKDGNLAFARRILEYVYTRELDERNFAAANFLGLAEIRLEEGDPKTAVTLLRRMTLVADEPFADLDAAASLLEKYKQPDAARTFLEERVRAVPWDSDARVRLATLKRDGVGLAAAASDDTPPYETCVRAARLLGRIQPRPGDQSELALLASGSVAASSAERPFYVEARLAAAERADASTRARVLADALAIQPSANAPRVPLFDAELELGRPQLAISALEPLLSEGPLRWRLQQADSPNIREDRDTEEGSYIAEQFLAGTGLDEAGRALAARRLAGAYEKLDRLPLASLFYGIANTIQPSEEARRALENVRREERLRAENARRRPVITENLEQDRLVRPRLTALKEGAVQ